MLIVDDSPVIIKALESKFKSDSQIEIVGTANSAPRARNAIIELKPDVIILDLDMPKFNGLSLLRNIMSQMPRPVVVFSAYTPSGSKLALEALSIGAFEVVSKPNSAKPFPEVLVELKEKILTASRVSNRQLSSLRSIGLNSLKGKSVLKRRRASNKVIAIATSTGGPRCLEQLFSSLPPNIPGVVVVQHITKGFTKNLAARLSALSSLYIREARDGDIVEDGKVLIAPGGSHVVLVEENGKYIVQLKQTPPVCGHRPSATVLFDSVAKVAGIDSIGLILSGMGSDGADGLLAMKNAGAVTFAQDESSSVVFGMAKEAYSIGACNDLVPLEEIAGYLVERCRN